MASTHPHRVLQLLICCVKLASELVTLIWSLFGMKNSVPPKLYD